MTKSAGTKILIALTALSISLAEASRTAVGQTSAVLNSNVEQTIGTSSRGHSAVSSTGGPTALPDDYSQLRLEPSSELSFDVFGVPELSELLNVDEVGNLMVPLIGNVYVAGSTLREAETQIGKLLVERQMLVAPIVSLKLVAYAKQSVTVAGEVQAPGKVQLLGPRPVLDVIAQAGGETTAAGGEVEIRHSENGAPESVQMIEYAIGKDPTAAQKAMVYPGDHIYVRRAGVVYVLGAVSRPGGYLMVNGGKLTVPQAIALALGTTQVASNKEAVIVQMRDGNIVKTAVPLKDQQTGNAALTYLADGDMLYIPTSKIKAALVNSQNVISAAASAGIISGLQR